MDNADEGFDSFDDTYEQKPDMFGHPYKELQDFFNNCSIRGNLFDLGCGQGRDSLFLASLGYKVTAVDNSHVGVDQMINKAKSQGLEIVGIVGDIQNLKLGLAMNSKNKFCSGGFYALPVFVFALLSEDSHNKTMIRFL